MIPPDSRQILEDPYYLNIERRLAWLSLSLAAAIVLTLSIFASFRMVVGFIAGSALSYYNFVWMKQGVDRLLAGFQSGDDSSARERRWQKGERRVIFKYFVRFALIGGSLYAIVRFRILDLKAFALVRWLSRWHASDTALAFFETYPGFLVGDAVPKPSWSCSRR